MMQAVQGRLMPVALASVTPRGVASRDVTLKGRMPRAEARASGEAGGPGCVRCATSRREPVPASVTRDMAVRREMAVRPGMADIAAHILPCGRRGVLRSLRGRGRRGAENECRDEASQYGAKHGFSRGKSDCEMGRVVALGR